MQRSLRSSTRRKCLDRVPGGGLVNVGKRVSRVLLIGDSDFASNRYLRSLYNLDLFMNAVHWAVERENSITLRPKIGSTVQFPVPLQNSLRAFYGVGMLIPELLLIAGGLVWLRRLGA